MGGVSVSQSESSVTVQLPNSLSQEDKALLLSQKFQQALFANPLMLTKLRAVFFPSSKYRYWHVDNIEIIDIQVCINFQAILDEHSKEKKETPIHTQCLLFRWSNSYFVNLIDIRQMTYFEYVTTGALFSVIAHGHKDRTIEIDFNLTHNRTVNSIEDTVTKQALIQFLSWVITVMIHAILVKHCS